MPLYRKILARYVHMATQAGVVQAVFPEGGLSLDGALQVPKLGLISYMVSGFDLQRPPRRRVHSRRGELRPRAGGPAFDRGDGAREGLRPPFFRVSGRKLVGFVGKAIWLTLRGRWYRYGYAVRQLRQTGFAARASGRTAPRPSFAWRRSSARGGDRGAGAGADGRVGADRAGAAGLARGAGRCSKTPERRFTAFELKGEVYELMARLEKQRRLHPYSPARPRIRHRCRAAHAAAAPDHPGGGRQATASIRPRRRSLAYYANAIAPLAGPSIDQPTKTPSAAGIADAVLEMGAEV